MIRRLLIGLLVTPVIAGCIASGVAECSTLSCADLPTRNPNYATSRAPRRPLEGYYPGGGANGYDRLVAPVTWRDGAEVEYGAEFLLPSRFMQNVQAEVDLVRWDNYPQHPTDTDWGGIVIWHSDHLARLSRFNATGDVTPLVGPFKLPIGSWQPVSLRQRAESALHVGWPAACCGCATRRAGSPREALS